MIDVTVPLQCLVKDSKLILTEASKVQCHVPTGVDRKGLWGLGTAGPGSGQIVSVESFSVAGNRCADATQHPRHTHVGAVYVTHSAPTVCARYKTYRAFVLLTPHLVPEGQRGHL